MLKNNWFQAVALFLMLIALPAGSWYYLQTGLDYRLEIMDELKDYGTLPDFEMKSSVDSTLNTTLLKGNITVSGFFDLEGDIAEQYGPVLKKLFDQFGKREELFFLIHAVNDTTVSPTTQFQQKNELPGGDPFYFLLDGQMDYEGLARTSYKLPLEANQSLKENPFLTLVDTETKIRNYYDIRKEVDRKRMVEHIALLLPQKPRAKVKFKREQEK